MKLSRYNTEVKINNQQYIIYNTLSRCYQLYTDEEKAPLKKLLGELNTKNEYTLEEISLLRQLAQKGIIVDDKIDELHKLEYLENSQWYQNAIYRLTFYATNACNFRCSYCTQEHIVKNIEDEVIENGVALIEKLAKNVKLLCITWFGGEPLLQYQKIKDMMKKVTKICDENNCSLYTSFVTNGYLLNENMISDLIEMHTESLQITVDSNPKIHNKRRHLKNGSGTYDKILQNIIILLEHGIEIVLRINIDEETFQYPFTILTDIPEEYRNLVTISISNLFQNEDKCSAYNIYLKAIEMGYKYGNRRNDYYGCGTCGNRNITIDTDGNILFCTNVSTEEGIIGKLGKNGIVTYSNRDKYIQDIMKSARDNETCRDCIQLPFCIGRCRLARNKSEHGCMGKTNSGLSLEECAKLDYYYDQVCNGGTGV